MAEGMSRTLNAGSDDASITYCEPCGNVPADGYCIDCPEFLCSSCANHHSKQRATKHHKLLRGDDMPSSHPTSAKPMSDTGRFLKCQQHPDEDLKFFCETHDAMCCMACTVLLHKQCNNVLYIPDVAKNYKTGQEYVQLTGDMNRTQQMAAKYMADIEEKINKVEQLKTGETQKLEKYRVEVKEYVDKRINELISEVKQVRDNDIDVLNDQHTKSKNIKSNIATTKAKLEACEQTPVELFVESKNTRNVVSQLQLDLDEIAAKMKYQVYSVHKDSQMESVLNNKAGLATVELKTDITSMWLFLIYMCTHSTG